MKKFLVCSLIFPVLLLGCKREVVQEDVPMRFSKVQVNIGGETKAEGQDTRSIVTIDGVEKFVKAALFAFDMDGKILVNGTAEEPYAITAKTVTPAFEWDLPVGLAMRIYVIENYGNLNLDSYLKDRDLRVGDLEKLVFTCEDTKAFAALADKKDDNGEGLPMSGIMDVKLKEEDDVLNVRVRKLFARYDFKLDLSAYWGYAIEGAFINAMQSNTEVPYFLPKASNGEIVLSGYKQTSGSKLNIVDTNGEWDLSKLTDGETVTLYFPENCQGNIYLDNNGKKPSSWRNILKEYQDAGVESRIENCSFIEFGIKASKNGKSDVYTQRVYLGDDMKNDNVSNFNVRRNVFQTLKISLSPDSEDVKTKEFRFKNGGNISLQPGSQVLVEYGWNGFDQAQLKTSDDKLIFKDPSSDNGPVTIDGVAYSHSGSSQLVADEDIQIGQYKIKGGTDFGSDSEVSSEAFANVLSPYTYDVTIDIWRGASPMKVGGQFMLRGWITRYKNGVKDFSVDAPTWPGMPFTNYPDAAIGYNGVYEYGLNGQFGSWSVVSGQGVSVDWLGVVTATQETTAVIRASAPAPDGNTYHKDITLEFTRGMTYEMRIILKDEDHGFDPNGQDESVAGDAQVNGYVEMRAYVYKVQNGQDLERFNATEDAVWCVLDNVSHEEVTGPTIMKSGSGGSAYVRVRSNEVADYLVRADYEYNQFGYSYLNDDIPVTFTSSGSGGGETPITIVNIVFQLTKSGNRYNVSTVDSVPVPCDVNITVTVGSSTYSFSIAQGKSSASPKVIPDGGEITSIYCAGTSSNQYIDNSTHTQYNFIRYEE